MFFSVTFRIREATKKFFLDVDMTDEEKQKQGYCSWDKYGWKGSGVLRFTMFVEGLYERTWQDSKRLSLEDQAGEIIDELANAEEEANRVRVAKERQEKEGAEARARRDAEWERQQAAEREHEREVKQEEESRARLVQKARDWAKHWLAWASAHANRLDPTTSACLQAEKQRITGT